MGTGKADPDPELGKSLQRLLLSSRTEREFICSASYLVPAFAPGCPGDLLMRGEAPRLADWAEKRYLAYIFIDPVIQSPVSTFGHSAIVATDHNDGTLELDAILLEFTAAENINFNIAMDSLSKGAAGRFELKWYADKQAEYSLNDRDLWVYPVRASVRTPGDLAIPLESVLHNKYLYRFAEQNCTDRIFQLFTEKHVSQGGTRSLAVPLEQLREIVESGWTLPPARIYSLSSKYSKSRKEAAHNRKYESIAEIHRLIGLASHSQNPSMVDVYRNEALLVAKKALQERDETWDQAMGSQAREVLPEPSPIPGDPVHLHRGPDLRAAAVQGPGGAKGWILGMRYGSFDFINSDRDHFQSSELEILSAEASIRAREIAFRKISLFHLNSLEVATEESDGQVRYLDLGWERYEGLRSKSGKAPSEAGIGYGLGSSMGWNDAWGLRASLSPVLGMGSSWNSPGSDRGGVFAANLGLRGQVQLNPGLVPRFEVLAEWRGLELNSPYRSRVTSTLVPWADGRGALYLGCTVTDRNYLEWSVGFALPFH